LRSQKRQKKRNRRRSSTKEDDDDDDDVKVDDRQGRYSILTYNRVSNFI